LVVSENLCTFASDKNKKINKNNNNHFSPSASRLSDENMNEKNVYIVLCNKIIADVFDSPEKAFNSLPKKDEFTEVYQTIRTCDGEEAIIPTADNFYLSTPIYVHVAEHTEDVMGFQVECQEETFVYEIKEFKVK
jgi:hypothetical protein